MLFIELEFVNDFEKDKVDYCDCVRVICII